MNFFPKQRFVFIRRLNGKRENNIVYLDYVNAMKDECNRLSGKLSKDRVHPNLAGHKIMEPLAEEAIAEVLKWK